ncbi:MAG: hypothetical protein WCF99_01520 [Chloroflexales bacterium]
MRIYECSMFFNEDIVSNIKISENSRWITETHITEANRTFKNNRKPYNFSRLTNSCVKYHRFNAEKIFRSGFWDYDIGPWWVNRRNCHWFNEAMVRNASVQFVEVKDEDVIIISDIDEIIDSRYSDEIIWAVQKHEITHLTHQRIA